MEALDIIEHIQSEQDKLKLVTIGWNGHKPLGNKISNWNITLINNPEAHFESMDKKHKNRVPRNYKFEMSSAEEGLQLCKGIFKYFEEEDAITIPEDVDTNKKVYLAVHVYSSFN